MTAEAPPEPWYHHPWEPVPFARCAARGCRRRKFVHAETFVMRRFCYGHSQRRDAEVRRAGGGTVLEFRP